MGVAQDGIERHHRHLYLRGAQPSGSGLRLGALGIAHSKHHMTQRCRLKLADNSQPNVTGAAQQHDGLWFSK